MSYCLLVEGQIIEEGETIVFSDKSELKIMKIHPKTQRVSIFHKSVKEGAKIPISLLDDASIIEKDKLTDPNILFKFKGVK